MNGTLDIWVVYDRPLDCPDHFVARRWEVVENDGVPVYRPTAEVLMTTQLDALRKALARMGLVHMERKPGDDPVILETWI